MAGKNKSAGHRRIRKFFRIVWKIFKIVLGIAFVFGCVAAIAGVGMFVYYGSPKRFPNIDSLDRRQFRVTTVLDRKGKRLGVIGNEKRFVVPFEELPKHVVDAAVAAEDRRFWTHGGVDYKGIARAFKENVKHRALVQGASTIDQQVAKNFIFINPERNFGRKFQEAMIAWKMGKKYSKQKIMEMYLNKIFFGSQRFGIAAAAEHYLDKKVRDLTVAEAAYLLAVPNNPKKFNPYKNPEALRKRQLYVLNAMRELGTLSPEEYEEAKNAKIVLKDQNRAGDDPFQEVIDLVRDFLVAKYGNMERVSELGFTVRTTVDAEWQAFAKRALSERKGPQVAIILLDSETREVRVLVGGNPYDPGGQNRAVAAWRQPGSLMKTFVYTAGFEDDRFTEETVWPDEVLHYVNSYEDWSPGNYGGEKFDGQPTTLEAFAHSLNTVASRIMCGVKPDEISAGTYPLDDCRTAGLVDQTIAVAKATGIRSRLTDNPSLVLGTSEVTLLDITNAYAAFADSGLYGKPVFIASIEGEDAPNVSPDRTKSQAVSEEALDPMRNLLRAAVFEGTGRAAESALPGLVSGKTGTTSGFTDAWFVGNAGNLTGGVWVGYDSKTKLGPGQTGSRAALPIWIKVVKFALSQETPEERTAKSAFPASGAGPVGSAKSEAPKEEEAEEEETKLPLPEEDVEEESDDPEPKGPHDPFNLSGASE